MTKKSVTQMREREWRYVRLLLGCSSMRGIAFLRFFQGSCFRIQVHTCMVTYSEGPHSAVFVFRSQRRRTACVHYTNWLWRRLENDLALQR